MSKSLEFSVASRTMVRRALLTSCALGLVASPLCAQATAGQAPAGDNGGQMAAQSQPAPTSAATSQTSLPAGADIIVTARRRAENLEKVPVAVTAFGSEQLAQRSITSQSDLQSSVSGLTVRANTSQNELNFSLRGQSVDAYSNSQPAVVGYVNEFQTGVTSAASLFDLENVQVLKGPQGTLFGRNATGGAVLYTTAKPTDKFEGFISGRYGSYDLAEGLGAINVPIVEDKVLARVAFDLVHQNGYIKNVLRNTYQGETDRRSVRFTLTIKPFDGVQSTTVGAYNHAGGDNTGLDLYSAPTCGSSYAGINLSAASCYYSPALDTLLGASGAWQAYLAAHPLPSGAPQALKSAYAQGYQAVLAYERSLGPYETIGQSPTYHKAHDWSVTNTTTLDINPDLTFKNIVGYESVSTDDMIDIVGAPYQVENQVNGATGETGFKHDIKHWSEEAQLQGKAFGKDLTYILGAYFLGQSNRDRSNISALDLTPIIPPLNATYDAYTRDHSQAVFAQATYDLGRLTGLNGLHVTGGIRYTWEQLDFQQEPQSVLYTGGPSERSTYQKPSWQVGLDYQVTPALLLYVVHRGSWRTGGFNVDAPPIAATAAGLGNIFLPETTHDIEGGVKYSSRVANMPLRLNIAVYNQWINSVQRLDVISLSGQPVGLTVNVPAAQVTGVEVDGAITPAPWLSLGGSFAYTNARYTNGRQTVFGTTIPFGPYADSPRYTGGAYAQVSIPTDKRLGRMSLRADVYAQTSQLFSNLQNSLNPGSTLPGYALVNLRYDWKDMLGSPISFAIYAKNVTDRKYFAGGYAGTASFGTNGAAPGQPRMVTGEVTVKF